MVDVGLEKLSSFVSNILNSLPEVSSVDLSMASKDSKRKH